MQRKATVWFGVVLISAMSVLGCTMRPPIEEALANAKKRSLASVLRQFGERVREDKARELMELVDPELSEQKKEALGEKISRIVWLRQYSGLRIDMGKTLAGIPEKKFNGSFLAVDIQGTNSVGQEVTTPSELRRGDSRWVIRDLSVSELQKDAALDIPEHEKGEISAVVAPLLEAIENKDVDLVMSMLPNTTTARVRKKTPNLWEKIIGSEPEEYTVREDLERVSEFTFEDWPKDDRDRAFLSVDSESIMVLYEVPYTWQEGGVDEDMLRIKVVLAHNDGGWEIRRLRLSGEGIPGT